MIETQENLVFLSDIVGVDEAEALLQWIQAHPEGSLDLSRCKHLHTANLQILMATRPKISAWPSDPQLADWLRQALAE